MVMPFNADEVFEMAEQIERNGAKFYRAAAEKLSRAREVLLDLASMEDEHEKTFAAMRAELSGKEVVKPVFDPDDEAQIYLRVMADKFVFNLKTDPTEQLVSKETAEDLLEMAIDVERDSIDFYVGMKGLVSSRADKEKVEAIIKEEISHIAILKKLEALE
ncbi:MAG: ferritin-like domain-containing protein [Planctomycetota bacterium]|jgi:rubrerythrin